MYIYVLKCSTHTQESFTSMSGYPFDNLNIHDWMKKCAAKTSLLGEKIMIATVTPGLRGDSAQREVSVEYLLLYYISSKPIFNNVQSCSKHNLSGMLFCGFSILWTYNLSSVFISICLFFWDWPLLQLIDIIVQSDNEMRKLTVWTKIVR